jgi:hypothetical protein
MPYEIKEKKNKKFSVVNKDTGKVMSKGTTKEKAKKQIKSIYANMKPEHRIRHRIGLLDGVPLHNPIHKAIVNETRQILKHEEIHGGGIWDWFVKTFPVLSLVMAGTKTDDIVEAVETYGLEAVGALVDPIMFPVAVASALYNGPKQKENSPHNSYEDYYPYADDYDDDGLYDDYDDGVIEFENIHNAPSSSNASSTPSQPHITPTNNDNIIPNSSPNNIPIPNNDNQAVEDLDKLLEKIVDESDIAVANLKHYNDPYIMDDAIRFPTISHYDANNKPKFLQDFLITSGVSGINFSRDEFNNTYKNQEPYAFLDFPINGGKLGKIDYSSVGYSKF